MPLEVDRTFRRVNFVVVVVVVVVQPMSSFFLKFCYSFD